MASSESLAGRIAKIQLELKAPKGQWNDFSKYNYRNCEDILEAVKPLMNGLFMFISDDVKAIGDRAYICATVSITDGKETVSNTGYAREALVKKGMDDSQITGSTSSYARKYALNGMFLIDDTKDADSMDNTAQSTSKPKPKPKSKPESFKLDATAQQWIDAAKQDKAVLDQINDQKYRKFIEGKL